LYGKGDVSPIPFLGNKDVEDWLRKNNVVIVVKQHPNMINKTHYHIGSDVIIDITKMDYDPQVIIFHSDVLISDYSSVWLDYLLLRRPIIHYLYDNFESEDIGLNIDMKKDAPGVICKNEGDLFKVIMEIKNKYDQFRPSEETVRKFFKYADGNSSERYYDAIVKEKYGNCFLV
jgi:CDP-glycerol glycerophosphotransferase